jgi:tetratricopeptide (TPR) repeat protein
MTWRENLRAAWRGLPARVQRVVLGGGAAALGLVLLTFIGSREVQIAAAIGLFGLFIGLQALILYVIWQQHPEVRQARRMYLAGDFEEAIGVLEAAEATPRGLDTIGLTLLGNAFRQTGRLEESERVLRAAYETDPDQPIVPYGLGRTLLAAGHYADSAALIAHALERRGQPVIVADLGHAQYRAGLIEDARASLLRAAKLEMEPYRALLVIYLLAQLEGEPSGPELQRRLCPYAQGVAMWRTEATRFSTTPYGIALLEDVTRLEELLGGNRHE